MIFLMQLGFTMLECGIVREKNSSNILLKNLLDTCVGALAFYAIGYGFSVEADGGIIGTKYFFATGFDSIRFLEWSFYFTYCSTCATIVSGSLAERTYLDTYLIFSFMMTAFIYPVVASWVWGDGWLQRIGFIDCAGSGAIHMLGGACGFVGAYLLGPRKGFYKDMKENKKFDLKKLISA